MKIRPRKIALLAAGLLACLPITVLAQTTTFTYQGRLTDGANPANGSYDLQFALFDGSGTQIGSPLTRASTNVSGGIFTVQLDFGLSAFPGTNRFLEIGVRPAGVGSFTTLSPRQQISSTPYAIRTLNAATADTATNSTQLGGVAASQYVQTSDSRLSDSRPPIAGSANYIQNTNSQQTANFNISGNGTVNGITSMGAPGSVYGYLVPGSSPGPYPTIGFNTYGPSYQAGSAGYGGIFQFQNGDGALIYYTGSNVAAGQPHVSPARVTIDNQGNVGIGTTPNSTARFRVKGLGTSGGTIAFEVLNSNDEYRLIVYDDGRVQIGGLTGSSTTHACYNGNYFFAACSSAAEYVPSIDGGVGYPETADLVSIAPIVTNPYGDTHGPFAVQKSATACDANLLGFIVKPESGADGKKLNDHYLPLAIYGYFPAKVTMENGAIHRGDAITSSSKPGYGMKATQACKIVGYALEDANKEGTIQVFAHHGEYAAPEVASLRAQIEQLRREKSTQTEALKAQSAALEARLAALEHALALTAKRK